MEQRNGGKRPTEEGHLAETDVRKSGIRSLSTRAGLMLLLGTAATVYALDQITKAWIVATFQAPGSGQAIPILGDYLRLIFSTNTGAAFGMMQDRTVLFTIIAVAAVPLILLAQRELGKYGWPAQLTLGLLLGGTLGNLTDRLRLGYVRRLHRHGDREPPLAYLQHRRQRLRDRGHHLLRLLASVRQGGVTIPAVPCMKLGGQW